LLRSVRYLAARKQYTSPNWLKFVLRIKPSAYALLWHYHLIRLPQADSAKYCAYVVFTLWPE
ncbi:hypothetical protein SK128_006985, partial [Halocaridina rubra]